MFASSEDTTDGVVSFQTMVMRGVFSKSGVADVSCGTESGAAELVGSMTPNQSDIAHFTSYSRARLYAFGTAPQVITTLFPS